MVDSGGRDFGTNDHEYADPLGCTSKRMGHDLSEWLKDTSQPS